MNRSLIHFQESQGVIQQQNTRQQWPARKMPGQSRMIPCDLKTGLRWDGSMLIVCNTVIHAVIFKKQLCSYDGACPLSRCAAVYQAHYEAMPRL